MLKKQNVYVRKKEDDNMRVYDKIEDEYFAKIKFITDHIAIAKILTSDEYIEEIENPESDVHYLSENSASE